MLGEVAAVAEPLGRLLGHRRGEHRVQGRQFGAELADRWRRGHHMFGDDGRGAGRLVGLGAGEHMKSRAGQRVLIRAPVDRLAHQLLGSGIGDRADREVRGGQTRGVVDRPGDAEVGQEHPL